MRAPPPHAARLFPGDRQQRPAIVGRVVQRIEAADQEVTHPEVVVVEQRIRHLLRGAHQRGGVMSAAHQLGDAGPQAFVHHSALRRSSPQPLGADAVRFGFEPAPALRRLLGGDVQDMLGFLQASASLSAIIGRNETLKPISRWCFAASARTRWMVSPVCASDSPHSAKTSACLPATAMAASDEPPK